MAKSWFKLVMRLKIGIRAVSSNARKKARIFKKCGKKPQFCLKLQLCVIHFNKIFAQCFSLTNKVFCFARHIG